MASTRTWYSGPPPHIGWWNASISHNDEVWYWWDGEKWLGGCFCYDKIADVADMVACSRGIAVDMLRWTDYYPHDARVPRIIPE